MHYCFKTCRDVSKIPNHVLEGKKKDLVLNIRCPMYCLVGLPLRNLCKLNVVSAG